MREKQNKGFTMVEVMVSIALISILMIPIISGIVSALKQSSTTKEEQQTNELAQHLMEYAKEDDLQNIMNLKYFESIGSYGMSKSEIKKQNEYTDSDGNTVSLKYVDPKTGNEKTAFYESYEITGSMNVGLKNEKYSYLMEISSLDYAKRQRDEALGAHPNPDDTFPDTYLDPNNLSMGIVEDLDYKKVALINGTIANYDAAVTEAFITKKLSILQEKNPQLFEQYVNQTYEFNPFNRDKVKRNIIISVSNEDDPNKYEVKCTLQYVDDSVYSLPGGGSIHQELHKNGDDVIEYTPYDTVFENKIPNIYLMYNVCLYNGFYSDRDYIIVDTSKLRLEVNDKEVYNAMKTKQKITTTKEVNLFVIETASKYSEGAAEALAEVDVRKKEAAGATFPSRNASVEEKKEAFLNRILYDNRNTATGDNRDDVHICLAASSGTSNGKLANVNIYHNFDYSINNDHDDDNYGDLYIEGEVKSNTKNQNLHYVDDSSVDSNFGEMPYVYTKNAAGEYVGSVCHYLYNSVSGVRDGTNSARIKSIDKAKQESRGLYTVKLWMVKGDVDKIDKSVDPLISGSKGGNAIEE